MYSLTFDEANTQIQSSFKIITNVSLYTDMKTRFHNYKYNYICIYIYTYMYTIML